jgi:hypothetical protein
MFGMPDAVRMEEFEHAANLLVRRYHNKRHALAAVGAIQSGVESDSSAKGGGTASLSDRFLEMLRARLAREPRGPDGLAGQVMVHHTHTLGSGTPLPCDVILGKLTGKLMVDAALSGLSRCVVCQWKGRFIAVPMGFAIGRPKTVNLRSYGPRTMSEKYLLTPVPSTTTPGRFEGVSEFFG